MDFSTIKNILKNNRFKALLLVLVTLISAMLIISSINMLSFTSVGGSSRTADNGSGKSNKNNPGNNKNGESRNNQYNNESQGSNGDWEDVEGPQNDGQEGKDYEENYDENLGETNGNYEDWYEEGRDEYGSEYFGDEEYDGYPNGDYTIPNELRKRLKNQRPQFNIDLSRDDSLPLDRYFGDGDLYSVSNAKKANHVPIFEILGRLDSPFIKLTVQDTYSNSKWYSNPEKTPKVYKFNEEYANKEKSCKIKFIEPARGFIPIPSNMQYVKVPVLGILNYPDEGVFYSDFMINDYYEVFLNNEMPDRYVLENSDVDPRYKSNTDNLGQLNNLADEIVKGLKTPYDKIEAIAKYLMNNFSSGTVKNRTTGDAVYRFLYDRKGSQLDFVSTFVVLLRCADIPSRLVTGYRVDQSAEYQIVYADQICVYPEVCFEGYGWVPLDYFADINPIVPPRRSITNITSLSETALKGEGFNVAGTVKDTFGNPLNGQVVLVYLKKDKNEECLSHEKGIVKNGVFDINCVIRENIDVGSYQVVARTLADSTYQESDSDPELKVLAQTEMSISKPQITNRGNELLIDASIVESLSKKPVLDGGVEITFTDTDKAIDLFSVKGQVQEGKYVASIDNLSKVKTQRDYIFFSKYVGILTGRYIGTDYYIPSTCNVDVNITLIHWWRIITTLIIALLAALIIGLVLSKRRKYALVPYIINDFSDFDSKSMLQKNASIEELKIIFPDIGPEFEDVWGINEDLRVMFYDPYGNFDELGMAFDKKGLKRISVLPVLGSRVNVSRDIRIVCYGEEVLALGKKLNDILYSKFGLMPKRLTPREIIKSLQSFKKNNVINGYTDIDIEKIILILEKAAYSCDDVNRVDYENFYKFVTALE